MALIRVGIGISSITMAISGVVAVDADGKSGAVNAAEVGLVDGSNEWEQPKASATLSLATGNMEFVMPPPVTSITVNAHVYAVASGKITNVVPVDGIVLQRAWSLISG